jgi:hypothetical protein
MKQVASLAGVSTTTASRVIDQNRYVARPCRTEFDGPCRCSTTNCGVQFLPIEGCCSAFQGYEVSWQQLQPNETL